MPQVRKTVRSQESLGALGFLPALNPFNSLALIDLLLTPT